MLKGHHVQTPGNLFSIANIPLSPSLTDALAYERSRELVSLTLDPRPLDRLIIVATPKRHFSPAVCDDDIAFGGIAVALYSHFVLVFGCH
jgi:hypothetical protein